MNDEIILSEYSDSLDSLKPIFENLIGHENKALAFA